LREPDELISDIDREQTVGWLQEHLVAGRLTLEEFSERVDRAYAARVQGDLVQIQSGLPPTDALSTTGSRRRTTRFTAGLFAHVVKAGRLRLRRWAVAGGAFCDVDLDLRNAEIHGPSTALNVFVCFGNVDVYIPENVAVTVTGLAVAGHRREWGADVARPHAPGISVRAMSLFGTVDVWRVPADMSGDYGEITRQLQGRRRELPS
jgi:hypothetical protein